MKVEMTRKIVAEIGDYPIDSFKKVVADADNEAAGDIEKIGFDEGGVLVVYSTIKVETDIVAIAEVVEDETGS